jgi:PAS domain S-box-containing protein
METTLTTTTLMTPEFANFAGNVHGGHILRLVDQVAYACASQYAGKYCVTLSVDRVVFNVPVRVGDLLTMKAQVNYTGRTSLQVGVRVEARDLQGGPMRHTNTCFLTMVAMQDGKPCVVPRLVPDTDDAKRRWARAALARDQASAMQRMAVEIQEYNAMVDLAEVAIVLVDKNSREVRLANRRATLILGRSERELEACKYAELFAERDRARAEGYLDGVIQHAFGAPEQFAFRGGDGQEVPLDTFCWLIPLPTTPLVQQVLLAPGSSVPTRTARA